MTNATNSQDTALKLELLASVTELEGYVEDALTDSTVSPSYVESLQVELSNAKLRLAQLDGVAAAALPTGDATANKLVAAKARKLDSMIKFKAKDGERTRDTLFKQRRNPDYDWSTDRLKVDDLKLWTQYKSDLTAVNAELIVLNGIKSARFDAPENEAFDSVFTPELGAIMEGPEAFIKLCELDDKLVAQTNVIAEMSEELKGASAFDALLAFARYADKDVVQDLFDPIFELASLQAQKNFSRSKTEFSKVSETPMMAEWKGLKTKWSRLAKHLNLEGLGDISVTQMEAAMDDARKSPQGFTFNEKWVYNMAETKRAIGNAWDEEFEGYVKLLIDWGLMSTPALSNTNVNNVMEMETKLKRMQIPGSFKDFLNDPDPQVAAAAAARGMTWQDFVARFRNDVNAAKNSASRKLPVTRNNSRR